MQRSSIIILVVLVTLGVGWIIFMSYVNTRSTALSLRVSGDVDEVIIFKSDDSNNPVASIQTNGKDAEQVIKLPNSKSFSLFKQASPAQYYFVTKKGDLRYRSNSICCQVGLNANAERRTLVISALDQYQIK